MSLSAGKTIVWGCISHNPTTWACGWSDGTRVDPILALVTRAANGRWYWQTRLPFKEIPGSSPSLDTAIADCMTTIRRFYHD